MAMKNFYDWYNSQKVELNKIVAKQLKTVVALEMDKSIRSDEKPSEKLENLSKRLIDEALIVLVMGLFSSGKSTFINALLGKRILPTSQLPTTAVITIVKYSTNKEIILYPKKGEWKGGNEPFRIDIKDLKKYITIDNESEEKKPTPFKKMEIFWDLAICKNEIDIVDSPGLDDPDSHDAVTIEYLPSSDVIIYCLNCNHPYTKKDHDTIEELRNLGYSSIIFILTNFDRVEESAMLDGDAQDKVFVRSMKSRLSKLTDLGEEGIFFIDSLNGVIGKENNDFSMIQKSYLPILENKLEDFLINQKGKSKLYKGLLTLKVINKDASKLIEDRIALNLLSLEDLQKRYENSKIPLEKAKQKGDLIINQIKLTNKDIVNLAGDKGRLFIIDCKEKIDEWVNNYSPTSGVSKNPFKMKESVKTLSEEYLGEIKVKLEQESAAWSKNILSPIIENSVKNMFIGLEESIKSYNKSISEIRLSLSLDKTGQDIANDQEPSAVSRLTGIAYSILTQDYIGGAMGATFGLTGLLKSLATQITAGIILGIASLFTPIGIPALIIGAIIAGITSAGWNFLSIQKNIKKKIIFETYNALNDRNQQEKMIAQITESVEKELNKMLKSVENALGDDIYSLQVEVEKAINEQKKGGSDINMKNKLLLEEKINNKEIEGSLVDFAIDLHHL